MKKTNNSLTPLFFILLILFIGTGVLAGWMISTRLYSRDIEDDESDIENYERELEFGVRATKKLPQSNDLQKHQDILKKLRESQTEKEKAAQKTKTNTDSKIYFSTLNSPKFTEMEQLVSKFAFFLEENSLHVNSLKNGTSMMQAQFMEMTATGSYTDIQGAISAITTSKKLESLVVSNLSISQVHEDGELALKLNYTFKNNEDASQ